VDGGGDVVWGRSAPTRRAAPSRARSWRPTTVRSCPRWGPTTSRTPPTRGRSSPASRRAWLR
jgi:hypothetical protein